MEDNCETITNFKGRESYGIILKLPKNYTTMKKKHMKQGALKLLQVPTELSLGSNLAI